MKKENKNLGFDDLELKQGEIAPEFTGLITYTPLPTDEQSQEEGWEKEFDDKWDGCFSDQSGDYVNPQVKDFIRFLLSQERTKVREIVEGMKMTGDIDEILGKYAEMSKMIDGGKGFESMKSGYNSALTDLLSKLKSN